MAVWTVLVWVGRRGGGEIVGDLGVKQQELSWFRLGMKSADGSEGLDVAVTFSGGLVPSAARGGGACRWRGLARRVRYGPGRLRRRWGCDSKS